MIRKLIFIWIAISAVAIIVSCSSGVKSSREKYSHEKEKDYYSSAELYDLSEDRQQVLEEARKWLGVPYCYGGKTKDCADCSGFVMKIFETAGYVLPRKSSEQFTFCRKVNSDDIRPADIVFFADRGRINHVGIYAGGNQFIHSSSSQGVVKQSLNDSYYRNRLAGFGRIIN